MILEFRNRQRKGRILYSSPDSYIWFFKFIGKNIEECLNFLYFLFFLEPYLVISFFPRDDGFCQKSLIKKKIDN